jgi:hypothetical protein
VDVLGSRSFIAAEALLLSIDRGSLVSVSSTSTTGNAWQPTSVQRLIRVLKTSTLPIECILDDGAHAFVKVMGNPEGPSALACEFIGTGAALLLGLPVFEVAIPEFPKELCVPLDHDLIPLPGPCFATRFAEGSSWDGRGALLDALEHPEHIPGLVVVDTWLRNPDRYFVRDGHTRKNLRNVFLREDGVPRGSFRLLAIDHTHVIRQDGELTSRSLRIDREREDLVYGLFPEFVSRLYREDLEPFVERLGRLAQTNEIDDLVRQTPKQWLSDGQVRQDLPGFLKRRATHVAVQLETWLATECRWDEFPASDL